MSKPTNPFLILLLLPVALGGFFLVLSMLFQFEPDYLQAKIQHDPMLESKEIGIVALILPAYYLFSMISFAVLGLCLDFLANMLNIKYDEYEMRNIFNSWCPFLLVIGVVLYRFFYNPGLDFMNGLDWFGFAIVLILQIKLVFFTKG